MSISTISLAPALAPRPRAQPAAAPALQGFSLDATVQTMWGPRRVDQVMAGDLLLDAEGRIVELRAIRRIRAKAGALVQIDPSALGLGLPVTDISRPLVVGAGQKIAARDWRTDVILGGPALSEARALVDGAHVRRSQKSGRVLCQMTFDRPMTLRVNGFLCRVG